MHSIKNALPPIGPIAHSSEGKTLRTVISYGGGISPPVLPGVTCLGLVMVLTSVSHTATSLSWLTNILSAEIYCNFSGKRRARRRTISLHKFPL